jgi:hypothetical protein
MNAQPFTPYEWDLLAGCARARAGLASADAKRNDNPEIRERFEAEERTYRDLTARCERLARQPAQPELLDLPVLRQPP